MTAEHSDLHPGTDAVEAALTAFWALLRVAARSISGVLHDVSLPQFLILVNLTSAGSHRTGTLAARRGALPSPLTRALDRMVQGGWVERVASPDSRREVLIRTPSNGRAILDEADHILPRRVDTDPHPADSRGAGHRSIDTRGLLDSS